jgi:arylsulfatase A-like enzyme
VRKTFIVTLLVAFLCGPIAMAADGQAGSRPNILLLMTDQHAATALGCVGNRDLKTPALDQLAAEGVRFDRAYVTQPYGRRPW